MDKHDDDGDWCLDSAGRPRMSISERISTQINAVGPNTIRAMRAEEAFIDSIPSGPWPVKKFRSSGLPGRGKLLP